MDLPAGEYTAKVSVAKQYRELFDIPDDRPTIKVTVREESGGGQGAAGSRQLPPDTGLTPPAPADPAPPTPPRLRPRLTTAPVAPTHPHPPPSPTRSKTAARPTTWATGPGTPTAPGSRPR